MPPADILIITHGSLAQELYNAACSIMGPSEGVHIYGIERKNSADTIKEDVEEIMGNVIGNRELLVLTDMLGGTPTNIAVPYLCDKKVDVITGVNLPMLITALHKRKSTESLPELVSIILESSVKSIVSCRDKLDI